MLAVCSIAVIAASPWHYASTHWVAQYWLVLAGILLLSVIGAELVLQSMLRRRRESSPPARLKIPGVAVFLTLIGIYASIQTLPLFDALTASTASTPSTIRIQRWFLGQQDAGLETEFGFVGQSVKTDNASADAKQIATRSASDIEPHKLSLSIEPLHTRAAVGSFCLAVSMIWIGSICFQSPRYQVLLLASVTLLGVVIGVLGVAHALSWNKVNWLGLSSGNSFASFVSRNTAGGFLNVCLSAAMGLATWSFIRPKNPNDYYDYSVPNPFMEFFARIERGLSRLTTAQIAAVFAVAFLLVAVACTTSRGATIGALSACLVTVLLSGSRRASGSRIAFAIVVVALGLTFITFFEFDERISQRFEELFKVENELRGGRAYIWGISLKAFQFFISSGSGLGTFHYAYLPFQNPDIAGWFYHAESLVAQCLVEFGWIGVPILIAIIGCCAVAITSLSAGRSSKNSRSKKTQDAILFTPAYVTLLALTVSLGVHSCVDFALVSPAVFLPASAVLGMCLGIASTKNDRYRQSPGEEGPKSPPVIREPLEIRQPSNSESRSIPASNKRSFSDLSIAWDREIAMRSTARDRILACIGLVLLGLLEWRSLASIDALARADSMSEWVDKHEKVARENRINSPSSYLAGLWSSAQLPIAQCSPAMRMIADALVYEFRNDRLEQMTKYIKGARPISWEETSPLLVNLALSKVDRTSVESEIRLRNVAIFGDEKQLAKWDKAYRLIHQGRVQCPLDWRLAWGEILLDRNRNKGDVIEAVQKVRLLAKHRGDIVFQLGVIASESDHGELALQLFRDSLRVQPSYAQRVGNMIALKHTDETIPFDIFPKEIGMLRALSINPFTAEKFPLTNAKIWEAIEIRANDLPLRDPSRWTALADSAAQKKDIEQELQYLREATQRNPMDKNLRMRFAKRLADEDLMDFAIEQLEFIRSINPDDTSIVELIKQWVARRDAN